VERLVKSMELKEAPWVMLEQQFAAHLAPVVRQQQKSRAVEMLHKMCIIHRHCIRGGGIGGAQVARTPPVFNESPKNFPSNLIFTRSLYSCAPPLNLTPYTAPVYIFENFKMSVMTSFQCFMICAAINQQKYNFESCALRKYLFGLSVFNDYFTLLAKIVSSTHIL